ncbi:MAG: ADP-ribosylation factor-like protein [Candidatus Heimdallarchaeota archaeon]
MSENMETRGKSRFVKRILLCGLEKSGRSSIRRIIVKGKVTRTMKENGAALNYFQWHLTKNSDSPTITVLDLGGQWPVLEKFISKLSSSVFYGIQALLFIIDISEQKTFKSANKYFKLVQQRVQDSSPSARIFVFLNKVDHITKSSELQKRAEKLKKNFQKKLRKEIGFYKTTIHDNSANEALFAVFREIMPEAEKQIRARLDELSMSPTQEEEISTAYFEPPPPVEKALELGIESEKIHSEINQPLDGPLPDISLPSIPEPTMNLGSTPSSEGRANLAIQAEDAKIIGLQETNELREILDQTLKTLNLSAVSLLTYDGKKVIKLGENLEQFDETIMIAQRTFKSASEHVPEGLEQLIIELIDSIVAITKIDETLLLITMGIPPFSLESSQKLMEFARRLATNDQKIKIV